MNNRILKVLVFVSLVMVLTVPSYGQKAEELKNSYNFNRGLELLDSMPPDNDGALEFFKKELEEHPNNGYAIYCMGIIYDNKGQEGEALEQIDKAIRLLKKDKEWITYVYRLRGDIYLKLGNDGQALADWESALKINPQDEAVLFDRAKYYYSKKDYDSSDADLNAILKGNPGSASAYGVKAINAFMRGDDDSAISLFSYAIKLSPDDPDAYLLRAATYLRKDEYGEAADDFITALKIDSSIDFSQIVDSFEGEAKDVLLTKLRIEQAKDKNNGLWSYLQGSIYVLNGEYRKAVDAFLQSDGIQTKDVTLYCISYCYRSLNEFDRALDYINRALEMDPSDARYLRLKSNILYDCGKSDEALDAVTSYIEKRPDDYYGYYLRAFFEDNTGRFQEAIEDYTTSIVISPDNAYSYLGRGDCYKRIGNAEAARKDYEKVVELDTTYTDNSCAQYAYLELGMRDKAIAFQDSIFAHTQDSGCYYDAACLYCRMGEYDKAMGFLKEAFERGFRRFAHIMNDDDLDALKGRDDFKALMDEYKQEADSAEANDWVAAADGRTGQRSQEPEDSFAALAACDVSAWPGRD